MNIEEVEVKLHGFVAKAIKNGFAIRPGSYRLNGAANRFNGGGKCCCIIGSVFSHLSDSDFFYLANSAVAEPDVFSKDNILYGNLQTLLHEKVADELGVSLADIKMFEAGYECGWSCDDDLSPMRKFGDNQFVILGQKFAEEYPG